MSIRIHVNLGQDFILECFRIESFIHVLKCVSAKIAETIRGSVHKSGMIFNPEYDVDLQRSFNPQSNLSCKHGSNSKCRSGLKLNPDSCKLVPLTVARLKFNPAF